MEDLTNWIDGVQPSTAASLHDQIVGRGTGSGAHRRAGLRGESRVLNEDTLLACTTCGTPFISAKLLASSFERIRDHPAPATDGRERLMTCPACRQLALLKT